MMIEYQISGSTLVTSRENGAVHTIVIDVSFSYVEVKNPTHSSDPKHYTKKE